MNLNLYVVNIVSINLMKRLKFITAKVVICLQNHRKINHLTLNCNYEPLFFYN